MKTVICSLTTEHVLWGDTYIHHLILIIHMNIISTVRCSILRPSGDHPSIQTIPTTYSLRCYICLKRVIFIIIHIQHYFRIFKTKNLIVIAALLSLSLLTSKLTICKYLSVFINMEYSRRSLAFTLRCIVLSLYASSQLRQGCAQWCGLYISI